MHPKNFRQTRAAIAATLLAAACASHAAPTLCNTGAGDADPLRNASGQQVGDVTYNGGPATNCYGTVTGNGNGNGNGNGARGSNANDSAEALNGLAGVTGWGTGWLLAARDNMGSGGDDSRLVEGLQWSVSSQGAASGTWLLTAQDVNGSAPANFGDLFDFVVALKGGNGYALYLFDDVVFEGLDDGGRYAITFRNGGGNNPALSHLSVYARYAAAGTRVPPAGGGNVPIPGSLPLAALGLGLLALARRRA